MLMTTVCGRVMVGQAMYVIAMLVYVYKLVLPLLVQCAGGSGNNNSTVVCSDNHYQ